MSLRHWLADPSPPPPATSNIAEEIENHKQTSVLENER